MRGNYRGNMNRHIRNCNRFIPKVQGVEQKPTQEKPMFERIQYLSGGHGEGGRWTPDNCKAVREFIGPQAPCPTCNGRGEYEGEYGPRACMPCCSRLIAFIDHSGTREFADWGDWIEKRPDGLHLIKGSEAGEPTSASADTTK